MIDGSSNPAHRIRSNRRCLCACVVIITTAVIPWFGCTVTTENYAFLSKWFDGVPDPDAVVIVDGEVRRVDAVTYRHEPYEKKACVECHSSPSAMFLNRDDSGRICLKCHETVTTQHPMMHGPVAAVACLWCHSPHQSTHEHLLRRSPVAVCSQCHSPDQVDNPQIPEHVDPTQNCLDCHFGHGGVESFFLRDVPRGTDNDNTDEESAGNPASADVDSEDETGSAPKDSTIGPGDGGEVDDNEEADPAQNEPAGDCES